MREEHWQEHHNYLLGYLLSSPGDDQSRISVLVIFNNSSQQQTFIVPNSESKLRWHWLVDTHQETGAPRTQQVAAGESLNIEERSVAILSGGNRAGASKEIG